MVYRGTGHLNFAQGEMALFSTLIAWWLHDKGVPLLLAIAISAAGSAFVGGALIEVGLMRPAGKTIGVRRGRRRHRPVPGVQLARAGCCSRKSGQGLPFPSLFPNKPDDFVTIFGAAWRDRADRRARRRAGASPRCCSCCSRRPSSGWPCARSPTTRRRRSWSACRPDRS